MAGSTDVFADNTQHIVDRIRTFNFTENKDSFSVQDMGFLINMAHLYRTYKYNINENNTSPLIGRFNSHKKDFKTIFLPYRVGERKSVIECLFEDDHILVCNVKNTHLYTIFVSLFKYYSNSPLLSDTQIGNLISFYCQYEESDSEIANEYKALFQGGTRSKSNRMRRVKILCEAIDGKLNLE